MARPIVTRKHTNPGEGVAAAQTPRGPQNVKSGALSADVGATAKSRQSCVAGVAGRAEVAKDSEKKLTALPQSPSPRNTKTRFNTGYPKAEGAAAEQGKFLGRPTLAPPRPSSSWERRTFGLNVDTERGDWFRRRHRNGTTVCPPAVKDAWGEGGRGRSETICAPQGMAPPLRTYKGAGPERTRRCTKEAVWTACDVFWLFDTKYTGEITRKRYGDHLCDTPTVNKLRMLRKSGLEDRFRKSAQPVTLQDWITMIWPGSTQQELELMMRWAALREAWSIVHSLDFRCHDSEMTRIYELLDTEGGRGEIPLGEFIRAHILSDEELMKLFRTRDLHTAINKETYRNVIHPHLKTHFVTHDTKNQMKKEEEAITSRDIDVQFRAGLQVSSKS